MDELFFRAIQEGLVYVFGPFLFWWLVLVLVVGLLSMIGVVMLEMIARMTTH